MLHFARPQWLAALLLAEEPIELGRDLRLEIITTQHSRNHAHHGEGNEDDSGVLNGPLTELGLTNALLNIVEPNVYTSLSGEDGIRHDSLPLSDLSKKGSPKLAVVDVVY